MPTARRVPSGRGAPGRAGWEVAASTAPACIACASVGAHVASTANDADPHPSTSADSQAGSPGAGPSTAPATALPASALPALADAPTAAAANSPAVILASASAAGPAVGERTSDRYRSSVALAHAMGGEARVAWGARPRLKEKGDCEEAELAYEASRCEPKTEATTGGTPHEPGQLEAGYREGASPVAGSRPPPASPPWPRPPAVPPHGIGSAGAHTLSCTSSKRAPRLRAHSSVASVPEGGSRLGPSTPLRRSARRHAGSPAAPPPPRASPPAREAARTSCKKKSEKSPITKAIAASRIAAAAAAAAAAESAAAGCAAAGMSRREAESGSGCEAAGGVAAGLASSTMTMGGAGCGAEYVGVKPGAAATADSAAPAAREGSLAEARAQRRPRLPRPRGSRRVTSTPVLQRHAEEERLPPRPAPAAAPPPARYRKGCGRAAAAAGPRRHLFWSPRPPARRSPGGACAGQKRPRALTACQRTHPAAPMHGSSYRRRGLSAGGRRSRRRRPHKLAGRRRRIPEGRFLRRRWV
eukprot:scaffold28337_cov72-Isochrysis_galbana.AAC.1